MTTRRRLAAVCAAALAALAAAPGASAHAVLIGTTPGNDSVLERSPEVAAEAGGHDDGTTTGEEEPTAGSETTATEGSEGEDTEDRANVALGLGAAGLVAGLAALGMGFRRRRQ